MNRFIKNIEFKDVVFFAGIGIMTWGISLINKPLSIVFVGLILVILAILFYKYDRR